MQLKDFFIRVDIKRKREIEPIEVVQGDVNSNVLNITLLDGGTPYDLYNLNTRIIFRKSDGTTVEQTDIEKVNDVQGKIRCILKSNTIASPGEVIAEVKIFKDDITVSSTTFRFYVRKSLDEDEVIESTNEFSTLTRLIAETNDLIDEVRQIEAQVPENVIERIDNLEELIDTLEGEVIDKVSISDIANTDTENNPYKVLGANVGYDLGREIDTLNDNLSKITNGTDNPAATNFDSYIASGNYTIGAPNNYTNIPVNVHGVFIVEKCGTFILQRYYTSTNYYFRMSASGGSTWEGWVTVK